MQQELAYSIVNNTTPIKNLFLMSLFQEHLSSACLINYIS